MGEADRARWRCDFRKFFRAGANTGGEKERKKIKKNDWVIASVVSDDAGVTASLSWVFVNLLGRHAPRFRSP
jgi:hypothetical protein